MGKISSYENTMLVSIGFIFLFTIGGLPGVVRANTGVDIAFVTSWELIWPQDFGINLLNLTLSG